MKRLLPLPPTDIGEPAEDLFGFPGTDPGKAWLRVSFVSSLDGVTIGSDGRSGSIATDADREVFPLLRRTADVILVGAGTVRAERYNPSSRPMAIISGSLDLPADLPLLQGRDEGSSPLVVFTTKQARSHAPAHLASIEIVECGQQVVDLGLAVSWLARRGWPRIHCEGGARLTSDLVRAGLVDEVLLTISPMLLGGDAAQHLLHTPGIAPIALHYSQVLEMDGTVFIRALVQR